MTFNNKKDALKEGRRIKTLLKSPEGWRVRTWENLGWHVDLIKGNMSLYNTKGQWDGNDRFRVLFSSDKTGGGAAFWTSDFSSSDPNKAIRMQLHDARQFVQRCVKAIKAMG